jgi:hypothetical protein
MFCDVTHLLLRDYRDSAMIVATTQNLSQERAGNPMQNRTVFLTLALSIAFACTPAGASSAVSSSITTKRDSGPSTQLLKNAPAAASNIPSHPSHLFPVNDEKGLLLTCIAPDIETNINTDSFEDCTLAPGRTLNDVMHSFVGAMHFEENQRARERAEWNKALDEKSSQAAQK